MGPILFALATAAVVWVNRKRKRKAKGMGEKVSVSEGNLKEEVEMGNGVPAVEKHEEDTPASTVAAEHERDKDGGKEEFASQGDGVLVLDDGGKEEPVVSQEDCVLVLDDGGNEETVSEVDCVLVLDDGGNDKPVSQEGGVLVLDDGGKEEAVSQEDGLLKPAVEECEIGTSEDGSSAELHTEESIDSPQNPGENSLQSAFLLDPLELTSDSSVLPDTPSALSVRSARSSESTESTLSDLSEAFEEILELLSHGEAAEDEDKEITSEVVEVLRTPSTAPISVPSPLFSVKREHVTLTEDVEVSEVQVSSAKLSSSLGTSPFRSFFSFGRRSVGMEISSVDSGGTTKVMRSMQSAQLTRAMSLSSLMDAGTDQRRMSVGAYTIKTRGLASLLEDTVEDDAPEEGSFITRSSFKRTVVATS